MSRKEIVKEVVQTICIVRFSSKKLGCRDNDWPPDVAHACLSVMHVVACDHPLEHRAGDQMRLFRTRLSQNAKAFRNAAQLSQASESASPHVSDVNGRVRDEPGHLLIRLKCGLVATARFINIRLVSQSPARR